MRLLDLVTLVACVGALGCGGEESSDSGGRTDVDLGDARADGATAVDVGRDGEPDLGPVPDAGAPLEVGTVPDAAHGCPPYQPSEGEPCDGSVAACSYPDDSCATTASVHCVGGAWRTDPSTCPSARCPYPAPPPGTACTVNTEVCTYWIGATRDCMATSCVGHQWTALTACTMTEPQCAPGVSCAAPSGCAVDKCANQCICGADGERHCIALTCRQVEYSPRR